MPDSKPQRAGRSYFKLIVICGVCLGCLGAALGPTVTSSLASEYRDTIESRSIIDKYVSTHPLRKLQIGAGTHDIPGWLNTDIEPEKGQAYLDAGRHFPLPDASFAYVFSEHVIEHLTYEDGLVMLRECHRILAPGGRIRTATPNLRKFIALFQDAKTDEERRYIQDKIEWHKWPKTSTPECMILNLQLRRWGHQFVYDVPTLRDSLEQAGFQKIIEVGPGESDDPQLRGIDLRHDSNMRAVNDYETMVLEAAR